MSDVEIDATPGSRRLSPWVALFLSLASCGLGQVYAGRFARGASLLIVEQALIFFVFSGARIFIDAPETLVAFVAVTMTAGAGYRIFTLLDATRLCHATPIAPVKEYTRWDVYLAFFLIGKVIDVLVGGTVTLQPIRVADDAMSPVLRKGEFAFVDTAAYSDGKPPKVGDVVIVTSEEEGDAELRRVIAVNTVSTGDGSSTSVVVRPDAQADAVPSTVTRRELGGRVFMYLFSDNAARAGKPIR